MFSHSLSDYEIAKQIASLININNGLSLKRRSVDIIQNKIQYVIETHGKFVIASVGIERLSYTLSEIKHLVVRTEWRRRGVGKFIVKQALTKLTTPLVYCTVRSNNKTSIKVFKSLEFNQTEEYSTGQHKIILLTKTVPTWERKCLNPTWKSNSSLASTQEMEELLSEPSSWEYDTPLPLKENI